MDALSRAGVELRFIKGPRHRAADPPSDDWRTQA